MLRHDSDPRLRSYLIHRLGRVRVDPETFLRPYAEGKDEALRGGLLLSLGQFDSIKLPPAPQAGCRGWVHVGVLVAHL